MAKKSNKFEDVPNKNQREPTSTKKSIELEDISTKYDPEPFFSLLDLFFERNKQVLVKHHIDSFNQFIEEIIPSILQNNDNVISEKTTENKVIRYRLTFDDLGIKPPSMDNDEGLMYPLDAIQKNLSYSSKYTATVTQWQDIVDINTGITDTKIIGASEKDVPIAKIPIMVGSKYCNLTLRPDLCRKHCKYDAGGYFIVNGSEKVVLSVETIIHRKPLVFTQKDQNSIIYFVRVQSRPATQFVGNTQVFTIRIKKDNSIALTIPQFKEISIFTLMRALGMETDEDIVDSILDVKKEKVMMNQLSISMNAPGAPTITREEAIEILINNMRSTKTYSDTSPEIRAQQKKKHLMKILTQFILPHVSSGTNNPEIDMVYKAHYIGYMIHKLLKCYLKDSKEVEEYRGCDDRDSMINKRIELTGILLGTLFEQFFKKMLNDCNKIFKSKNVDDKKPPNIINHIKPNPIEQGLRQALSTGAFGSQSRKGLSQMLNRMNHLHSASYLRRVITPTVDASTNKMTSPRHLHNTQYGSMCPLETPEGHAFLILF
jgi:DNA-directed RNA polymerase II subunit RPB2